MENKTLSKKNIVLEFIFILSVIAFVFGTLQNINSLKLKYKNVNANIVNIDGIDKDYLVKKMLNTIDNFNTVEGSFEFKDNVFDSDYTSEYKVRLGDDAKSYEKAIGAYINCETLYEYSKKSVLTVDKAYKTYKHSDTADFSSPLLKEKDDIIKNKKPNERFINDNGISSIYYRQNRMVIEFSRQSLDPQEMVLSFLVNSNNWHIESSEKIADVDCIVIRGSLNDDIYAYRYKTSDFTMWVNPETGFLLKFECFDKEGNLSKKLETTYIKINSPLLDSDFKSYPDILSEIK